MHGIRFAERLKRLAARLKRVIFPGHVTGARKQGGNPKGSKRSATYGSGEGTRAVPSIDAVYAAEALPPLKEPAPGETRMLREAHLTDFVSALHQPHRVQRKPRTGTAGAPTPKTENGSSE